MIIRKAELDDVEAISQLITPLVIKYILPTCSKEGGLLILNSMAPNCISNYLDAGYVYHVAELNSELIGVVGMKENAHLYHLFIADSQQGKGLSRTLWELARDVCLANGNEGKFTVNSALNATDVYLKFGFVPVSGVRERAGIKDMPMELEY
ncbi:GNAT family N-acetyltransferase [Moritella sp. 36]|uniref:GNAT family N-acetyltransferase n=1 Tax=Moritella sp. 36 TaxID=2746233 RepID=UPI001BAA5AC8|nr:GNAT family N-acetyltransferase [Moritella sp. 36]QUM89041.1 GNAT family N-acetyltransferase [Moritella sp. 36]